MNLTVSKHLRFAAHLLGLAFAYWSSATLVQTLSTPTIYASAVWPPAGIALGAVLVWGRASLWGVTLGALFANGQTIVETGKLSLTHTLVVLGMSLGAALQASIVASLIRRYAGYPSLMNQPNLMVRFLLLAGPLGCCINATLGNLLLMVTNGFSTAGFFINWLTWWVGDSIGVLIFVPLMLIAFARPRSIWSPRWLTVALPLIVCFMLATAVFAWARHNDGKRRDAEFGALTDAAVQSIESNLHDFSVITLAMKALFDATGEINCAETKSFADILLEHKRGLQALAWAKQVDGGGREALERFGSLCHGGKPAITERGQNGDLSPAARRDEYLPVMFVHPLSGGPPGLGYDLFSDPAIRDTMHRARDTGELSLSPPITFGAPPNQAASMLMAAPIYRQGAATDSLEQRRRHFTGAALSLLDIGGAVKDALNRLGRQQKYLNLQILALNPGGRESFVFAEPGYQPAAALWQRRELDIGGRHWQVAFSGHLEDFGQGWFVWFVLAGGLSFSGLLGGFLLLLTGKTMSMESLVEERTKDLAASNQRLRQEIAERSRTEIALRESESRFRMLANAAPVMIWLSDAQMSCYWFNQVWLDFTGKTLEEEAGKGWALGAHPDDLSDCLTVYASHFEHRIPFRMEYRLQRRDGTYRWVVDSGSPLIDDAGQFAGYIGSCIDVTERKLIEQETARLALVAEKTTTAIIITDANGAIEWVNPAFEELTGYPLPEVQGLKPGDFLQGPETDPQTVAYMRECVRRKQGFETEIVNYHKNGRAYWLHIRVNPVFDAQGRPIQFIAVETDISERKASEKAIQNLNRSYQDLLNAASEVAIISTDPAGIITLFNRGAERMLGYPSAEIVGQRTPAMFHLPAEIEARAQELAGQLGRSVAGFGVFTAIPDMHGQEMREWTYVCKDGLCIWVSLVVTQIKSDSGATTGYLGIAQNITERKAAETALHRAKLAADEANRAKSEFLANMSHEIRTPMNGILGMIELLRGTPLNREQHELAETASHSATVLMEIINDILDFSKIEAGKLCLESREFNVGELCESVCSLLAVTAQAKGLEFNCQVQPHIHETLVLGDPTRLRQVLLNLIGNAVKFTPDGEVYVEAANQAEDDATLLIGFSVKDTGIGMRPEELERLFMPFEQADYGTTRQFGGTGLGLSISRSLVELMGGQIGVESSPNQGACFQFSLRFDKSRQADSPPLLNLAGRHALLADDNPNNLEILTKSLSRLGMDVTASDNGMAALEWLRAGYQPGKPFDVAIVDRIMPQLSGDKVIEAYARLPNLPKTPCILMNPGGIAGDDWAADASRVVSISKPVRQSQLYDALATLLGDEIGLGTAKAASASKAMLPQFESSILLVEDNPVNQRVMSKFLQRFGLTADIAQNGREALQKLSDGRYDLVFMDCQIPIMDGYAVVKAHRERERSMSLPRTPIVALTANAIQGDTDRSLEAGMDAHLTKPLSLSDLELTLNRWLTPKPTGGARPANPEPEVNMSKPIWDYQAALHAACGDVELLEELKTLFTRESAKLLANMTAGESPEALATIANCAHSLKGMAAHFHAKPVVELAAELEGMARQGDPAAYQPLLDQLRSEVARLVEAFGHGE